VGCRWLLVTRIIVFYKHFVKDIFSMNEKKLRIREARKNLMMNQLDFASKIGISRGQLSRLESGENEISEPILYAIEYVLGVNRTWLLTGQGTMFVENPPMEVSQKSVSSMSQQTLDETLLSVVDALNRLADAVEIIAGSIKIHPDIPLREPYAARENSPPSNGFEETSKNRIDLLLKKRRKDKLNAPD